MRPGSVRDVVLVAYQVIARVRGDVTWSAIRLNIARVESSGVKRVLRVDDTVVKVSLISTLEDFGRVQGQHC